MRETVDFEILKQLVLENSKVKIPAEEITEDMDLIQNFEFDSLMIISLVVALEKKFEVEFEDEKLGMEGITRLSDLALYISERKKGGM